MNNIFTDRIIIEEPGYLGAIQAFSLYKPKFSPVQVCEHGMDLDQLKSIVSESNPKLIYSVPNFQNPSGITYTTENRKEISDIIYDKEIFLIEDDPYGDLRFSGTPKSSFKKYLPKKKDHSIRTFFKNSCSRVTSPQPSQKEEYFSGSPFLHKCWQWTCLTLL